MAPVTATVTAAVTAIASAAAARRRAAARTPWGLRRDGGIDFAKSGFEQGTDGEHGVAGLHEASLGHGRADLSELSTRALELLLGSRKGRTGQSCRVGRLETARQRVDCGVDVADPGIDLASDPGLLLRGAPRRGASLVARFERLAQRLAVVRLLDGRPGAVERRGGGLEFGGGERLGASRTGGVDGALRLVHLPVGRLFAARRDEHREEQGEEGSKAAHRPAVYGAHPEIDRQAALMKGIAPQDRPREKLERLGPSALGDNEVLALVLGHGQGPDNALALANRLLAETDGLAGLVRVAGDDLQRVPGIGVARAARVLASVELGRRTLAGPGAARRPVHSAADAAAFLVPQFGAHPVERVGVVLLDARQRLVRTALLTTGTIDSSVVHPRDVYRVAIAAGAASIIVFHNHPSGDPTPSQDDLQLTWRLVAAGELLGVEMLDHVVIAERAYFSFREAGRLRAATL